MSEKPISDLRRRMLEDMAVRQFGEKTKHDYIRHVTMFAKFLGRSPDTATAEDVRRFQVHLSERGVQPPTLNGSASALRRARHSLRGHLRCPHTRHGHRIARRGCPARARRDHQRCLRLARTFDGDR